MHRIAVYLVLVAHLAFVIFVALGGFAVPWQPWLAWVHLPIAIYGLLIEWVGWTCPLTPLEKSLRRRACMPVYEGDFLEQYVLPWLPLPGDQQRAATWVGVGIIGLNLLAYGLFLSGTA